MYRKPASAPARKGNLSQYGLMDVTMPGTLYDGNDDMGLSDDDIDLEAELAALDEDGGKRRRSRTAAPSVNLDAMIAASLTDVPEDDDVASDDENDPDLLNELHALAIDDSEASPPVLPTAPHRASRPAPAPPTQTNSVISLLEERISNYTLAEKNAKEKGESSRARRFGRGLKTLNDLLKQAKAGRPIKDEDIPPAVVTGTKPPEVSTPDQPPPVPPRSLSLSPEEPAAPSLPQDGASRPKDEGTILLDGASKPEPSTPPPQLPSTSADSSIDPEKQKGLQIILTRQQDFKKAALAAKHSGDKPLALEYLKVAQQFDLVVQAYKSGTEMDMNELPTPEQIEHAFKTQNSESQGAAADPEPTPPPVAEDSSGLITASTVDEALKQRLAVFQEQELKAKEQGNSSKQRRMGRIVKQYEDAIKLHSLGKPIPVDELPTPPGFAPIPVTQAQRPPPRPAPSPSQPPKAGQATRAEKQLAFLLLRQREFREAAIDAKKNGNIGQAKEYLRAANGFNSVIEAARGGLAVDLKSLPVPPKKKEKLDNTFDIISAEDCTPSPPEGPPSLSLNDTDVLTHLHQQLASQLKLSLANRDHCKAMGNIADANRFEQLAVNCRQDLDVVTVAKRLNQIPPKFHYVSKNFALVKCNTDLNETDLELTIVRGIAYNVPNPKDVDTYVKFEFPYPQEAPVSDRTQLIKDSNSPEYNAVFTLPIQRNSRPCQRVFKRHGIKFEVYSRGGWFSKDALLGVVNVKLAPLETHVTLHEAFPIMDGRRPAGGSLEIKLRVRTPLLQPEIDNSTHRWLCLNS